MLNLIESGNSLIEGGNPLLVRISKVAFIGETQLDDYPTLKYASKNLKFADASNFSAIFIKGR